jgi:hypothetical protein
MESVSLNFAFDAVVMLTWSDWHTEPRSNRYHYATRFARYLPVFFVQPDIPPDLAQSDDALIRFEPLPDVNITIVHLTEAYGEAQAYILNKGLKARGIHRPLLWIYNTYLEEYIRISRPRLRIYHATEDYVSPTAGLRAAAAPEVAGLTCRVLQNVDLLIAVSEGVARAYRAHGGYTGPTTVLANGCDYKFWGDSKAQDYCLPADGARVVLFQGGINGRLDYDLLLGLTERLPNWRFWFCGDDREGGIGWKRLCAQPNVVRYGNLSVEALARLARQALVGIIPFKQDPLIERSLPLKAYEYVACGLPVVSVPITALAGQAELFALETTPNGFARAIKRLADTRTAPEALAARRNAAEAQSYDRRFPEAVDAIANLLRKTTHSASALNVLMLYDEASTHVRTIYEHSASFQKYSRHFYYYMSATNRALNSTVGSDTLDFDCFDAIVIHYSVRVSLADHMMEAVAEAVRRYHGPKLLFIQDEYETTETAWAWIERLGIDSIYTNIPLDQVRLIYPRERFPNVDFVQTLTGYVPDDAELENYALPLAERRIFLGYRGRLLPHHYGVLGYEKYRIGQDMRQLCLAYGIPADIEVADTHRIHGTDWYRFVGSCRAMLGTETGSNVFDFDGSLKALGKKHANLTFAKFADRFLKNVPTPVNMNQISPKIFEAIRLRTALVLFEGHYSGIIKPERHYILLKKDYSNVESVFSAIANLDYLKELTEKAYREIIEDNKYSYRLFVDECDRYIDARVGKTARATIVSVPVVALYDDGTARRWPISLQLRAAVTSLLAEGRPSIERANVLINAALTGEGRNVADRYAPIDTCPQPRRAAMPIAETVLRAAWRLLPARFRSIVIGSVKAWARALVAKPSDSVGRKLGRAMFRLLPPSARNIIRSSR